MMPQQLKGEPEWSFHPCEGKALSNKFGWLVNHFLIFTSRCNLTQFLINTEATARVKVRNFCQVSARYNREKSFGSSCTSTVGHKMGYEYPER